MLVWIESPKFVSHKARIPREFNLQKDSQSKKWEWRPQILVKVSFRVLCDSKVYKILLILLPVRWVKNEVKLARLMVSEWMIHFPLKSDLRLTEKTMPWDLVNIQTTAYSFRDTLPCMNWVYSIFTCWEPLGGYFQVLSPFHHKAECNHKKPILDPQGDRSRPRKVKKR